MFLDLVNGLGVDIDVESLFGRGRGKEQKRTAAFHDVNPFLSVGVRMQLLAMSVRNRHELRSRINT